MADLFTKTCSSCGAPIIWAESKAGKPTPLDAKPESRFIFIEGVAQQIMTYTSHFATCPNADQHRRGK